MVNADAIKDRVLESEEKEDEKSIRERVAERFNQSQDEKSFEEQVKEGVREAFDKNRIYVDSEEDVPDQYTPQTSDRGAVYYETDDGGDFGYGGEPAVPRRDRDNEDFDVQPEEFVDRVGDRLVEEYRDEPVVPREDIRSMIAELYHETNINPQEQGNVTEELIDYVDGELDVPVA